MPDLAIERTSSMQRHAPRLAVHAATHWPITAAAESRPCTSQFSRSTINELDSLIALGILNRIRKPGWRVSICSPQPTTTSMNGVVVHAQCPLSSAASADGEKEDHVDRAMKNITPYLQTVASEP